MLLTSLSVWLALTVAMLRTWLVNRRNEWLVNRFPLLCIYGWPRRTTLEGSFFDFGFCYIYLESLTLASASCRQTIVLGTDSAIRH